MLVSGYEIINGELFYVEFDEGEKIQEKLCNFLGHDLAEHDEIHEIYTIQKGTCRRCRYGHYYFKTSKKESERYNAELKSLC